MLLELGVLMRDVATLLPASRQRIPGKPQPWGWRALRARQLEVPGSQRFPKHLQGIFAQGGAIQGPAQLALWLKKAVMCARHFRMICN